MNTGKTVFAQLMSFIPEYVLTGIKEIIESETSLAVNTSM
jgi:hypothetical protein